jgi:hypothetical protein
LPGPCPEPESPDPAANRAISLNQDGSCRDLHHFDDVETPHDHKRTVANDYSTSGPPKRHTNPIEHGDCGHKKNLRHRHHPLRPGPAHRGVCGHSTVDTTMGYAAIYPEDVIAHHRAFIARRRAERPSEEYRDLTAQEWDEFLAHFELRKVGLGTCGRDHGTPCAHENACVRCPLIRVDPAQMPRLEEIRTNLVARLQEAKDRGCLGEVAAIETTMSAATQNSRRCRRWPLNTRPPTWGCPVSVPRLAGRIPTTDAKAIRTCRCDRVLELSRWFRSCVLR